MKNITANTIRAGVVVALLSLAPLAAASARGGATRLVEINGPPIAAPAAPAAMNCGACKDGTATVARATSKGASNRETTVARHLCKECTTRFEVKGHGKAKELVPVHACPACKS